MRRLNRIVWGILLAFGALVVHESLQLSYYGTDFGPGPGFFSFWLGVLVIGLSLVELTRTLRQAGGPLPAGFLPDRQGTMRILSIVGALAASLVLMAPLGFSLTMLGFCIFLLRSVGRFSWWTVLPIAGLSSFGLAYVFRMLYVLLPRGILGI
jgi:hypothetical protein